MEIEMSEVAIRELSAAEIEFVSGGNWFADLASAVGAWVSAGLEMAAQVVDVMDWFFSVFDVEFHNDGSVTLHFR